MRVGLISALVVLAFAVQAMAVRADQEADETDSSALDAAGWEVLRQTPRLQPRSDTAGELRRILSQEEYQGAHGQEARESWLRRQWEHLQEQLTAIGAAGTGIWGVILAGMLLGLLVFLVARLMWQWATRGRSAPADTEGRSGPPQTAEQLQKAAERAAEQGDYRAAIRFRYLALLRALNLPTAALMTNSQIRRRVVRRHPALQGAMGDLVVNYEDCWYGGLAVERRDYELAEGLARVIEERLAAGREDERTD